MKTLALVLAASMAVAACASNKTETVAPAMSGMPVAPVAAATPAAPHSTALSPAQIDAQTLSTQLNGLQKKSVYFAFKSTEIATEYRDTIQQQAAFIRAHPKDSVTLAGNTDERGSEEYNLALGQKRAATVQHAFVLLGVPHAQVKSMSYGESQPRLTCHAETCWQENRRVDFAHSLAP